MRKEVDRRQADRNAELRAAVEQDRSIEIAGFQLIIRRDVFPPDLGFSTLLMARVIEALPPPTTALDMGTGCGFLAMILKRHGADEVIASDMHEPAVACARENLAANGMGNSVKVVEGDLFEHVPADRRFQLIVFNQPFYPIEGEPIAGMGIEGGRAITARFLEEAVHFLSAGGMVMMSSGALVAPDDRPDVVARECGWYVTRTDESECGAAFAWLLAPTPPTG